ncbi:MAG: ABC transporter ATP-binding protein [Pseudorhodoplanes sp.]|uniref:ABC transporter ATP-binding protein n=1 Tax=Pseudorhodoplanes sp. TaxID=1934341 RepID=UPI003D11791A
MLAISDLNVAIKRTTVLRGVGLKIADGSFVTLAGRNGAGKTTLMRSVMGLLPVQSGTIEMDGAILNQEPDYRRVTRGIGYMPEGRRLIGQWTVEQNILLPLKAMNRRDYADELRRVYDFIPELHELTGRRASTLSGGQQKLVALARALVCGSKLLLLDEPFEGIAPALAVRLTEILSHIRREKGRSVLLSESDFVHSDSLVDDVFLIERGEVTHHPR